MNHKSIRWKILVPLFIGFFVMAAAFIVISYVEFQEFTISDCVDYAKGLCGLIADEMDAEHIDDYLKQGRAYPGYDDIEKKLYKLRAAYPDIQFLYVYQIREDGCHVVFDLDTDEVPAAKPGALIPFDEAYRQYIPDLLAGKEVPSIVSRDSYGYLLTIYNPIFNAAGECKCYVGVDYSMDLLTNYVLRIMQQILLLFAIVVAVIIVVSVIMTNRGVVKPMNRLENRAYRDTLTGLMNRTAYYESVQHIDDRIRNGTAHFSLLMIDVNFLKKVNDTYGHDNGNVYLKKAAEMISAAFGAEHLYRIGGDEFVVVSEGEGQNRLESRIDEFRAAVKRTQADDSLKPWERVSAAVGAASFRDGEDQCAEDVLRRADKAMYADKIAMKAERRD
ncbi:MAG: GGDEF domain-containing protein [Clostridia bacterium]|nr:GGDEF domain-containing protein [Clostridia bacterium]